MSTRRMSLEWRVICAAVLVAVLGTLFAWLVTLVFTGGGDASATLSRPFTPELVARGAYLARVGDCVACHSAPGGGAFAGGLPMHTPVGTVYSSNITPDPDTGIGHFTYGQFERAVRRGIAPDGGTLYPAMPFPSYARVSDSDMHALYAYFMQGVAPVRQANRASDIAWPLSMRWPLTYWRWLFAPAVPDHATWGDDAISHGAYLVETLGHCGACHTPRGLAFQEKALGAHDGDDYLAGAPVDHWFAPSLRDDPVQGIGRMSREQLVTLLKTGRNDDTAVFGGMSDVVRHSTQYMSDADLADMATYLKSLGHTDDEATPRYDDTIAKALRHGDVSRPGAQLFVDNCATCHRTHGKGYEQTFPALALNPVVNGTQPDNLIRLVLQGGAMPGTKDAPTEFAMPGFADRLSDDEVAQVLTFVRSSWGNRAPPVQAADVAKVRRSLPAGGLVMTDYDPRR